MYYLLCLLVFSGAALGMYNSYALRAGKSDTQGKYLCVPCGYIYDPVEGDPDSGIAPGTRFEDIPDTWVCPVCGVSKKDFIPLGTPLKNDSFTVDVVGHSYVNVHQNVLELKVKTSTKLNIIPGQYFSFIYEDTPGEFRRSYSVVKVEDDVYTFLIRLGDNSRSAVILRQKKVGDRMKVFGVFGEFHYRNTPNKKIFIATGTGLAPIYHMLKSFGNKNHILIYGAKDMQDAFYIEQMQSLDVGHIYIYLSQQQELPQNTAKCSFISGRLDLCNFLEQTPEYAQKDTEFYLCGNPNLIESCMNGLKQKGYTQIYSEKF